MYPTMEKLYSEDLPILDTPLPRDPPVNGNAATLEACIFDSYILSFVPGRELSANERRGRVESVHTKDVSQGSLANYF
jgi:hypothetical protein